MRGGAHRRRHLLFDSEPTGFFHSLRQLLSHFLLGLVVGQIKAVEASVSLGQVIRRRFDQVQSE